MSWLLIGLVLFGSYIPGLFRLMKLAHDQSVLHTARRAELKRRCEMLGGPDNSLSGCAERTGGHR